MLPLPVVLQQRYFANVTVASEGGDVGGLYDPGVTTDTPEAVQTLAGLVFWAAAAFSLLLVLHLPVVAFVARRIAAAVADERTVVALFRERKLALGGGVPSEHEPADLYDQCLNTFPRYETWLVLLVFQGLAETASAVLAEPEASETARHAAVAVLVALAAFLVAVASFLWTRTRGADARTRFVELDAEGMARQSLHVAQKLVDRVDHRRQVELADEPGVALHVAGEDPDHRFRPQGAPELGPLGRNRHEELAHTRRGQRRGDRFHAQPVAVRLHHGGRLACAFRV